MAKAKLGDIEFAELQRAIMQRDDFKAKAEFFADRCSSADVLIRSIIMRHNSKQSLPMLQEDIAFVDYLSGVYYTVDDDEYQEKYVTPFRAKKDKTH